MKSLELKKKREGLQAEMDTLANKAELTDVEKQRWEELTSQVESLNREIKEEERNESIALFAAARSGKSISKSEEKDIAGYSFVKAIKGLLDGKLTGLEAEMHQEAINEMRNIAPIFGVGVPSIVLHHKPMHQRADITTATAPMVETELTGFIDALTAKLFAVQMGADLWTDLKGNLSIPRVATAATAAWATEVANAADAGSDTEAVSVTPKRLACYQDISKLLIRQSPYNIEQKIRELFISAMYVALEGAIIEGATNGPTGILATSGIGNVAGGTNGLAPTLAHMLALQKEVAIDNADIGKLGYLCSPLARWKLMSTAIESGHPDRVWNVLQPYELLGYKASVTTLCPDDLDKGTSTGVCSAIVFGNFEDLLVAQFGGVDITIDPYTVSIGNKVRVVLNSFWDSVLKHPASFAAMKDALCAS